MGTGIRRRLQAIEERLPKSDRPVIVVHRDGDAPERGLFDGPPWCGGEPVKPSELSEADVLLISWVREWRESA